MTLLAQQWSSADGFVAGRTGEQEVFAAAGEAGDQASETHNLELLRGIDEVLLGRRTYEGFASFWPEANGEAIAEPINRLPKTVCSTSLSEAPWGDHAPATIAPDAAEHVRALGGSAAILWGSIELMGSLMAAGLVDELELFVAPVVLGEGIPLLAPGAPPLALALRESEQWSGGVMRLRYAVRSTPGAEASSS